jgi:hypothetical protein
LSVADTSSIDWEKKVLSRLVDSAGIERGPVDH